MHLRRWLVIAHRWAGLTIATFVVIAGVTGAALPFLEQLRWLCAPGLWDTSAPMNVSHILSGPELAERVERATGGQPAQIPLDVDGGHAVSMFLLAPVGQPPLGYDQIVVDPYTGDVRAKLRFGAVTRGKGLFNAQYDNRPRSFPW